MVNLSYVQMHNTLSITCLFFILSFGFAHECGMKENTPKLIHFIYVVEIHFNMKTRSIKCKLVWLV